VYNGTNERRPFGSVQAPNNNETGILNTTPEEILYCPINISLLSTASCVKFKKSQL